MKKGSGTFFVYRKFCGRTTQSVKRAKAGYHYDGGILPFALRNQVRFVRTWSSPYMRRIGGNRCVRAYMAGTHVRSKKEKFLHIGVFFRLTVWYTQLNKSEFEEIE